MAVINTVPHTKMRRPGLSRKRMHATTILYGLHSSPSWLLPAAVNARISDESATCLAGRGGSGAHRQSVSRQMITSSFEAYQSSYPLPTVSFPSPRDLRRRLRLQSSLGNAWCTGGVSTPRPVEEWAATIEVRGHETTFRLRTSGQLHSRLHSCCQVSNISNISPSLARVSERAQPRHNEPLLKWGHVW